MEEKIVIGNLSFSSKFFSFFAIMLIATTAFAISTPSNSATFAYDVYRIGIEEILQGPIGFVGGVAAIVFGAITAIRGAILQAVPALLGGGVLLKADSIVTTFGMLI